MVVETLNGMQVGLGGGGSPSFEEGSYRIGKYSMEERKIRIHRYQQKRTQRNFNKKIKVFRYCLLNLQMHLEFLRCSLQLLIEVDTTQNMLLNGNLLFYVVIRDVLLCSLWQAMLSLIDRGGRVVWTQPL